MKTQINLRQTFLKMFSFLAVLLMISVVGYTQSTEYFEDETYGSTSFTNSSETFTVSGSSGITFDIFDSAPNGWGANGSDKYIDNYGSETDGAVLTISNSVNNFYVDSFYIWPDQEYNGSGTVSISGKLNTITQFTYTYTVTNATKGDWFSVDFSSYSSYLMDELVFTCTGDAHYLAVDDFAFNIAASNTAPTATAPSAPSVSEDATNVVIANDIQVADSDGDDQTVTFTITGGTLTLGTAGITFGGSGNGSASFTANGTLSAINTALDAATFTPTANVFGTNAGTIAFTSNDGTDDSNDASVSFNIDAVNDEPTLSATGENPTFTEDASAAVLYTSATASAFEGSQSIIAFTCTVTNVNDGVNEILNVDGTAIALTNGTNGTTSGNSLLYSVSVVGTTATITFSGGTVATSNMETIVEAISYQNNSDTPTTSSDRTVTITSIQDNGGTADGGDDTAALSIASTVTVVANNDAPTLTSFTDVVETTNQNTEVEITYAELIAQGNENDVDGTVDAFIVKALSTGTLTIGANSGDALAFNASSNYTINTSNNAYWTPASNVFGTQNAFTTTVIDNGATESAGAVQATVQVNDVTNPDVSGITITGSPVANATTVTFIVAFTESVKNVSTDDFSLTTSGTASGTIASVSSSTGTSINVTVNTISGTGTLRLDLDASTDIADLSDNTPPAAYNSGSIHTVDCDNPILSSSVPNDEDTGVDASANLTLTFSENIAFGTGNIQLIDLDDGSGTITIDAASPGTQASILTNTITINPASDLEESVNYAIQIAATAIDDVNGNSYAGILDNTTLNFQSADVTPPTLDSSFPAGESTNMTLSGNIVLTFDDNMVAGTGNITIRLLSNNSIFEQIPVSDARIAISANQVTIDPTVNLSKSTGYYIEIDPTALDDNAGNSFAGISGNSTLNFSTVDVVINEVVTEPQTDWSTTGFNGFDGGGAITNGTDEWIELYINSAGVDLSTGWTIEISSQAFSGSLNAGGAFQTINYVGTGTIADTDIGDFLVLGNPISSYYMNLTTTITLKDPGGATVDEVSFGASPLPSCDSDDENNESAQRILNGTGNWTQGVASLGAVNTGPSVTLSVSETAIAEAAGTSTITATLSAKCSENVTVNIGVNGLTTAEVGDYTLAASILITAGDLTGTTVLTAIQDLTDEINETVVIDITDVTNGIEAGIQQQTVTITDDDAPPIATLSQSTTEIAEDSGVNTITATLSTASERDVTVMIDDNGTAYGSGIDYTISTNTIVISAGNTEGTATITAKQDDLDEVDEIIYVDVTTIINCLILTAQQVTCSITDDDDPPTVALSATPLPVPVTIAEGAGVSTVTATLSTVSAKEVTVNLDYTGTADGEGTDYTASSSSIIIAAGSLSNTATISSVQDLLDEDNETVIVDISTITNGTEETEQQATIYITDDDPMPSVNFTAASQSSADESGTLKLTAQLTAVSGRDVSVPFSIDGSSTATGGATDYSITASPITIAAGNISEDITIAIASDLTDEDNESVIVNMGAPTNATQGTTVVHTATITDDDLPPLVTLSALPASITEAGGVSTVTASLSVPSAKIVTVDLGYTGTAIGSGTDYTASGSSIVIPAGSSSANRTITADQDILSEGNETVIVDIALVTNGTEDGTQQETITIVDDDSPSVTLSQSVSSFTEAAGVNTITATLANTFGSNVEVTIGANASSTATGGGTDYTLSSTTITVLAGQLTGTATITANQDLLDEDNESVVIDIISIVNGIEDGIQQVTSTVTDDDAMPTVSFTSASQSSTVESGTMTITAQLSAVSGRDVSVPFSINGLSTATGGGTDYAISASPLVIAEGTTTADITLTVVSDALDELNETVVVDMGTPTNATTTGITSHTATIDDDDPTPTVAFNSTSSSGAESVSSANLQVDLSAVSGLNVTVNYTVTGTATGNGTDYTLANGILTINAGDANENITIASIVNDLLDENNETVIVTLSNAVNATLGTNTVHTYTINDDDPTPTIAFNSTSSSGLESVSSANLQVDLSAVSGLDVTVNYTVSGTASDSGTDYTLTNGVLTINAGNTDDDITIASIVNDLLDENNETVVLTLSDPTNATLGTNTVHTYTILDDDATPTISFTAASQNSTAETGTMTITAQLSAVSGLDVTLPFTINGAGTATNVTDYTFTASPVSILTGNTSANIIITINEDDVVEANETVIIDMGSATNAIPTSITSHTATITNDDYAILTIESTQQATEGSVDGQFTISTNKQFGSPVTVDVDVLGTATEGTDYSTIGSSVNFSALTNSINIPIDVLDDALFENDETVILGLTATNNSDVSIASSPDSVATVTITDDELPPSVNFTASAQSSILESGVLTITAELSEVSGLDVTVPFTVNASSTATGGGIDYSISTSPLTISAGQVSADITITIAADVLDEYDETIIVNMGAPVNATQGTVATHTATITDDDAMPTVAFVSASQSSADESGNMYITAVLSAFSGRDVVVPYSVNGTSTAAGADYSISAGPLTIAAGDLSEEIIISIHEDDLNESDETVIVNIGTAVNATSGVITTHTANITDDDFSSLRIETALDAYEGDSDGAFWIITDTQVDSPFEILFSLSGTAVSGIDYSSISSPLIFPANTDTLTVTIAQLDDLISETREDVIMNLVNTNNNSVSIASAPDSTAIMYFYDNDILQLEISAPALTLSKTYDGNNTATVMPGVLTNPHPGSDVSVSATATYNDSQVGTGKTITVKYSIRGADTDMYYAPIDEVFNNGEIEAVELFVTASDKTKIYGHPNPDFTISYKGFIEGEDSTVLTTLPTTMVYGNGVNVGMYPIWVIGGQAKNYKLTHISGMLDITKATLTVKADDQIKEYGDDNNQLTLTYSGWINGEEQIDIAPVLSTNINKYSPAGTYTDTIEVSGGLDNNYSFNYIPGTYSITKANLTISANTIERTYGSDNPEAKLSFSGWKNDNHFISEMPVVTTQIDRFTPVGNYNGAIILSDGSDRNYNLELINGDIIINKAPLTVSAVDQTTLINQPITTLELQIEGLVNGETENVIDIMPTASTTATTDSKPGVYPIIVSGGSDNNYSFSYQDGILTIEDKQIPVITWQTPNSIEYGTSLDENQLNATTNISGNFIYNPVAGTILDAGNTYTLSTTFTPDDEASYQVVSKTVNIDVIKAEIVATAIDTTIKAGNPIPVFNINYQGFKHNDSYSDIDVLPVVSTIADSNSPAGEYELTVNGGTDNNYTFVYNNGILTIEPETSSINIAHLDAVVFPNPFKNVLNIRINSSFKASYTFSNISGQTLIQGELNKPETQIELPVLRNGVYLLDVKQNEKTRTFRVVKQ